ncbi:MAG: amylo-alpha-1,6-glucosidase [Nitrospinota bacterium]
MSLRELVERAKAVLEKNWTGNYTIPSASLYPHQWNWDSGFIAIGNAYLDVRRSMKELEFLLSAQWKNGMVPHQVYEGDDSSTYFPTPEFLDIHRSPDAPDGLSTSGMTQPPVLAIASHYVYEKARDKTEAEAFLRRVLPKIQAYHDYLLTVRDPEGSGAVTLIHPWESGMDNSPVWDGPLRRVRPRGLEAYRRVDLQFVDDPSERPDDEAYDRYVFLMQRLRDGAYDVGALYDAYPFKVKDVGFTSILYADCRFLLRIAETLGEDTRAIRRRMERIKQNFRRNFCPGVEGDPLPYSFDVVAGEPILKRTVASLLPLYAGLVPKETLKAFTALLDGARFCGTSCHVQAVPSTGTDEASFTGQTYWRGPVWVNTNWMLYYGLLQYGVEEKAREIREGIVQLVETQGFREYFDPFTGEGYGADDFSWTAALVIDLLLGRDTGVFGPGARAPGGAFPLAPHSPAQAGGARSRPASAGGGPQSSSRRRRRALPMTETEENVMAALAMMGLSRRPKTG